MRAAIENQLRSGRYKRDLLSPFARAILKYDLVKNGDKIAVCMSGGKDSTVMAKLFQEFQRHGQFSFELEFICMDPGYAEENRHMIEYNADLLGIPVEFFNADIFKAVDRIKSSPCYICARMRRGYLYRKAQELGCNKIALGHHFDDVIETVLMGMLNSGQFSAMMPKLVSDHFEGMELIRPMYFVREDDIKAFRDANQLHFLQCACHFTEEQNMPSSDLIGHKRNETKMLIAELRKTIPYVETNIFHSTENVMLDKVLGYKEDGERHSFLDNYEEP